jgi:hypothetical protein
MEGKIFLKAVRHLLDPVNKNEPRREFDIVASTLEGDIIRGRVVCTSSNFRNDTLNLKFIDSGEIRTIHASLLFSVNNREVLL